MSRKGTPNAGRTGARRSRSPSPNSGQEGSRRRSASCNYVESLHDYLTDDEFSYKQGKVFNNSEDYELRFFHHAFEPSWKDMIYSVPSTERDSFYHSLVNTINKLRQAVGAKPLKLHSNLCRAAHRVWNFRKGWPNGLDYIIDIRLRVNFTIVPLRRVRRDSTFERFSMVLCLLFTDDSIRSIGDLPHAALHYWLRGGERTTRPAKRSLPPLPDIESKLSKNCRRRWHACLDHYKVALMHHELTDIGVHVAKLRQGRGALFDGPYSVLVLLQP